jgi:ATP-dependent RNA helicase DDX27
VIAEEREERELRKAEMEATKAQNMLDHEAEIYSRPARTWFQSSKEKAAAAARAKVAEVRNAANSFNLSINQSIKLQDQQCPKTQPTLAMNTRLMFTKPHNQ